MEVIDRKVEVADVSGYNLKRFDSYGINFEEKRRDRVQWFVPATSRVGFAHPVA